MENEIQVQFELAGVVVVLCPVGALSGSAGESGCVARATVERARERLELQSLASQPTVAALRKLVRAAGCDPTRYRPSSEALIRRVLKGAPLPAINSLVDINNCLSLELAVPCCVMAEEAVGRPMSGAQVDRVRAMSRSRVPSIWRASPSWWMLRVPVTYRSPAVSGSRSGRHSTGLLVAYLPQGVVSPVVARERLERLLAAAPVAQMLGSCYRPAQTEETQEHQDG